MNWHSARKNEVFLNKEAILGLCEAFRSYGNNRQSSRTQNQLIIFTLPPDQFLNTKRDKTNQHNRHNESSDDL